MTVVKTFVYILGCLETKRVYVGQTNHLIHRVTAHRAGKTRTTREKLKRPVVLYWETCPDRAQAMRRERQLKQGSGARWRKDMEPEWFAVFRQFHN